MSGKGKGSKGGFKKKAGQLGAGMGIIGAIFSSGSTSGGLLGKSYTTSKQNYDSSQTRQRDQQSRHVRGGTRDQGSRRGGNSSIF